VEILKKTTDPMKTPLSRETMVSHGPNPYDCNFLLRPEGRTRETDMRPTLDLLMKSFIRAVSEDIERDKLQGQRGGYGTKKTLLSASRSHWSPQSVLMNY
jgi:hypothetical protein